MTEKPIEIDVGALTDEVHTRLGQALATFSNLESQLALIFGWLLYPADQETALIAFDAIGLLQPKIRTLRAAARHCLETDDLKRLEALLKRVSARSDVRNKLAHWTVSFHPPVRSAADAINAEARLVPPWFSAKNLRMAPDETVTAKEIRDFTVACGRLGNDLMQFVMHLQNRPRAASATK